MTFHVIAKAQAKREWNEAVDWYESQQSGVGLRFDDALQTLLQSLSHNPDRFRHHTRLTHKASVPRPWPYTVYFTINIKHQEVAVLAIWHNARNPEELRRRLE